MLFTDGLIERRGEPIDARFDLLAERARAAVDAGEGWCDAIVDAMIGARRDDDVALLGVRIDHLRLPELRLEVPAELAYLRTVRERARNWLVGTRRVERGSRSGPARRRRSDRERRGARVRRGRRAAATRRDARRRSTQRARRRRRHLASARDNEGRGLQIIERMSDTLTVDSDDFGTTIRFTRLLARDGTADARRTTRNAGSARTVEKPSGPARAARSAEGLH